MCFNSKTRDFNLPLEELYRNLYLKSISMSARNRYMYYIFLLLNALIPGGVSIWLYISPSTTNAASSINLICPIIVAIIFKFSFDSQSSQCYSISCKCKNIIRKLDNLKNQKRDIKETKTYQKASKIYTYLEEQLYSSSFSLPSSNIDIENIDVDEEKTKEISCDVANIDTEVQNEVIRSNYSDLIASSPPFNPSEISMSTSSALKKSTMNNFDNL